MSMIFAHLAASFCVLPAIYLFWRMRVRLRPRAPKRERYGLLAYVMFCGSAANAVLILEPDQQFAFACAAAYVGASLVLCFVSYLYCLKDEREGAA